MKPETYQAPYILLKENAGPAAGISGHSAAYVKSDGGLYVRTADGVEHVILSPRGIHSAVYTLPLRGVADNFVNLEGEIREVANTQAGDYAPDFAASCNHIYIFVDGITTGGDLVITGTSVDPDTGIPTGADTETIAVNTDEDVYYMSYKHWWEITNIDVSSGTIVGIDYDVGVIQGCEMGGNDFTVVGYHWNMFAQGANPDARLILYHMRDDGSNKMSLLTLEDIGVDADAAGDQIVDHLRGGGDDRSYNPVVGAIWGDDTVFSYHQRDFNTYFTSDENKISANTMNHSGLIIRLEGEGGGLTNVDFCVLHVLYILGV